MSISTSLRHPLADDPSDVSECMPDATATGSQPNQRRPGRRPWPAPHLASRLRALFAASAPARPPLEGARDINAAAEALQQVAATVEDVLWIYEPHGDRFLYVSPSYEREWRRDASALYADSQQWLRTVHPDDQLLLKAAFDRLSHGEGYDLEYRTTLYSGAERWIAEKVLPVAGHATPWPRFA